MRSHASMKSLVPFTHDRRPLRWTARQRRAVGRGLCNGEPLSLLVW
jgi:hypothetical protein